MQSVMGKGTLGCGGRWRGCCKLWSVCSTQTLIITSSAGSGADGCPRWPQKAVGRLFFSPCRRRNVMLHCSKWKGDGCPASERRWRSAITSRTRQKRGRIQFGEKCITLWRKRTGGVVALVLVTECECTALITTVTSGTLRVQLWCHFLVLWPEIQPVSRRRSTLHLARCHNADRTWRDPRTSPLLAATLSGAPAQMQGDSKSVNLHGGISGRHGQDHPWVLGRGRKKRGIWSTVWLLVPDWLQVWEFPKTADLLDFHKLSSPSFTHNGVGKR